MLNVFISNATELGVITLNERANIKFNIIMQIKSKYTWAQIVKRNYYYPPLLEKRLNILLIKRPFKLTKNNDKNFYENIINSWKLGMY